MMVKGFFELAFLIVTPYILDSIFIHKQGASYLGGTSNLAVKKIRPTRSGKKNPEDEVLFLPTLPFVHFYQGDCINEKLLIKTLV